MVNNSRISINFKDKKNVDKYVNKFLNNFIKEDLFLPKNKNKLRKFKMNCINNIKDIVNTNKKAKECFKKSLKELCWKYFSKDKKITFNTKDICKIRKQIENC